MYSPIDVVLLQRGFLHSVAVFERSAQFKLIKLVLKMLKKLVSLSLTQAFHSQVLLWKGEQDLVRCYIRNDDAAQF